MPYNMIYYIWKIVWDFLKMLSILWLYDIDILVLGIYTRETKPVFIQNLGNDANNH